MFCSNLKKFRTIISANSKINKIYYLFPVKPDQFKFQQISIPISVNFTDLTDPVLMKSRKNKSRFFSQKNLNHQSSSKKWQKELKTVVK